MSSTVSEATRRWFYYFLLEMYHAHPVFRRAVDARGRQLLAAQEARFPPLPRLPR